MGEGFLAIARPPTRSLNVRKELVRFGVRFASLDVVAEVALRVLEIRGGVGEGESEGVADGDERGHEGAEAGDGDRVRVSRQGSLEHDVAHEKAALGSGRSSNSLKALKKT